MHDMICNLPDQIMQKLYVIIYIVINGDERPWMMEIKNKIKNNNKT